MEAPFCALPEHQRAVTGAAQLAARLIAALALKNSFYSSDCHLVAMYACESPINHDNSEQHNKKRIMSATVYLACSTPPSKLLLDHDVVGLRQC